MERSEMSHDEAALNVLARLRRMAPWNLTLQALSLKLRRTCHDRIWMTLSCVLTWPSTNRQFASAAMISTHALEELDLHVRGCLGKCVMQRGDRRVPPTGTPSPRKTQVGCSLGFCHGKTRRKLGSGHTRALCPQWRQLCWRC